MAQPRHQLAVYEDLLQLSEDTRAQIVAGEILMQPAPLPRHSRAQRSLGRFVGGPYDDDDGFGGPGGWWIFVEVDVRLSPHDIVRPDLAGWRRERLPNPGTVRPIDVAPDWICEVLSLRTVKLDRIIKRELYARHGVKHYWLVDPEARTLEALELDEGRWRDAGAWAAGSTARIAPFIEIEIELQRIFLPPEADPSADADTPPASER